MFLSVLDQLIALEARILEKLTEAEESAAKMERDSEGRWKKWTVIPGGLMAENGIAISWLGVRAKALELVRQRDALGNRVLFAQMSVISSYVSLSISQTIWRIGSEIVVHSVARGSMFQSFWTIRLSNFGLHEFLSPNFG